MQPGVGGVVEKCGWGNLLIGERPRRLKICSALGGRIRCDRSHHHHSYFSRDNCDFYFIRGPRIDISHTSSDGKRLSIRIMRAAR